MKHLDRARVIVLVGTGTEIGKTVAACAMLRASPFATAVGFKPAESGYASEDERDSVRLLEASRFASANDKTALVPLLAPFAASPTYVPPSGEHLATTKPGRVDRREREGRLDALVDRSQQLLIETAGGLFSPMPAALRDHPDGTALVADYAREVREHCLARDVECSILLVALNRLGELNALGAASRAAALEGLQLDGIILNHRDDARPTALYDLSDIRTVTVLPVVASVTAGQAGILPVAKWQLPNSS